MLADPSASPLQVASVAVIVAVGKVFTVTFTASVPTQPLASVAVIVYVVEATGTNATSLVILLSHVKLLELVVIPLNTQSVDPSILVSVPLLPLDVISVSVVPELSLKL